MEKYFNALVAVVATFFTYVFGSWDLALQVLIVFMILDYGTGVLYAFLNNQLNSEVGFKGLVKKMMILVVLIFLAGLPAYKQLGSQSCNTVELEAMMQPSPIVTPAWIELLAPIHAPSFISTVS